MIKTKEYRVLWSTRFTPEQIKEMMKCVCGEADDHDSSDDRYAPGIVLYPFDVKYIKSINWDWYKSGYNFAKPISVSYDEKGYIFTMKETVFDVVDPVLHPIIKIDTSDTADGVPEIRRFCMFERKQLNLEYLYDGVNYPENPKIGNEILFSDLRKAQIEAWDRLCKPVVRWDELEKDTTSSVVSFPFKKRISLVMGFSNLKSYLNRLESCRMNRLDYEDDKQSEHYKRLNNEIEKYRNWIIEELDEIL